MVSSQVIEMRRAVAYMDYVVEQLSKVVARDDSSAANDADVPAACKPVLVAPRVGWGTP